MIARAVRALLARAGKAPESKHPRGAQGRRLLAGFRKAPGTKHPHGAWGRRPLGGARNAPAPKHRRGGRGRRPFAGARNSPGAKRRRRHTGRALLAAALAAVALPAAGVLLLIATAPGQCSRDPLTARTRAGGIPRIQGVLPDYDATLVCYLTVEAPPAVTFAAITEANILDPIVRGLFRVRELPQRVAAWVRGQERPAVPDRVTFRDLLELDPAPAVLVEEPGVELVVGSVGRFWEKDYGARHVAAGDFAAFDEPGHAKLAMSLRVEGLGEGRSLLRYEARTATTDETAARLFRRYWRLISPGVAQVMRRALGLIRKEAERRAGRSPAPAR